MYGREALISLSPSTLKTSLDPSKEKILVDLETGLSRLGLQTGQVVEMHSSLSNFGPLVELYAEALRTDPWGLYGVIRQAD